MQNKKYNFAFTEDEMMLLLYALSHARPIITKKLDRKELADKLSDCLSNRINKIYGISKEGVK